MSRENSCSRREKRGERKKGRCGQRKKARAFKFRIRGERKEEEEKSKKT